MKMATIAFYPNDDYGRVISDVPRYLVNVPDTGDFDQMVAAARISGAELGLPDIRTGYVTPRPVDDFVKYRNQLERQLKRINDALESNEHLSATYIA